MTSQTINLNLIPQGVNPVIHVNQYDKGQTWYFYLYEGDVPFTIPAGSTVTIQGTKKDGTGFQYLCSFTGNKVTATETEQMTLFYDKYPCEISIAKSGAIIGSLNFIIEVEQAPLGDDTIISATDLPLLQQAIEAAPLALGYSQDAESYAVGTRGGTAVPSTDPAYHNNAKYYADNFVGYVTDAQYSAIQTLLS